MNDAQFIYEWADQWKLDKTGSIVENNGTPFMVFGEYNYEVPFPWQKLTFEVKSNDLTPAEIDVIIKYVEDYKKDPRNFEKVEESEDLLAAK